MNAFKQLKDIFILKSFLIQNKVPLELVYTNSSGLSYGASLFGDQDLSFTFSIDSSLEDTPRIAFDVSNESDIWWLDRIENLKQTPSKSYGTLWGEILSKHRYI